MQGCDRIEISNPGIPPIQVERFIDEYRSRNEQLADLMRRFSICEEKGSGNKSVLTQIEMSHSQILKPLQNQQKSVLTQIKMSETFTKPKPALN